jgi:hypothetical protein
LREADIVDCSLIEELDASGFIDEVYVKKVTAS